MHILHTITQKRIITFSFFITVIHTLSFSQRDKAYKNVDPFIGTAKSDVYTKWGDEGGTYPGAVAPSGYIQLSPETHINGAKGYNYYDSTIYFFSCLHHASGFPEGSSGRLYVMPIACELSDFGLGKYNRPFSHKKEKATPGYYKVAFNDDSTLVEAAVAQRSGMFRFTFPGNVIPKIFIGDAGKIEIVSKNNLHLSAHHAVINLDKNFSERKDVDGGSIFVFNKSAVQQVIILKISASTIDEESAQENINEELGGLSFDALHEKTKQQWSKELSVVEVEDTNEKNKTVFYTALYHSLLIPWIISDAEGNYRGHDGLIHKATGKNEYGQFSPWDTFHSLHPLLCLLYPDKQKDMVLSMLDIFKQTHRLPTESMTGNHSVPIIVDSYLKGVEGIDSNLAYDAMKKSIMVPPFRQDDLSVYHEKGYVPFLFPESVTRTVEYAYDDWALSQFAKQVMHDNETYSLEQQRGLGYKNLFNASELFLLPRNYNEFKLQPGNSGYKEGDQWVYSFFVPQNANDLINLMGGDSAFANRLDNALALQKIIFDNETVFHLPYLFNETNRQDLTQKWLRSVMLERFNATPGGLPGNDDLGAVSSWYVFSAMGFYPFCPGNPNYTIGSPIFKSVTLHLGHQKKFVIKSTSSSKRNIYIRSLIVNHQKYKQSSIAHALIKNGGEMIFTMIDSPDMKSSLHTNHIFSETKNKPAFEINNFSVSSDHAKPNELLQAHFSITNSGSSGTKIVKLFVDGKEYATKNCFIETDKNVEDSINFRLYPFGNRKLSLEGANRDIVVNVESNGLADNLEISHLSAKSIIEKSSTQQIYFEAKNIDGVDHLITFPVVVNGKTVCYDTVLLKPGESKFLSNQCKVDETGMQNVLVANTAQHFKVIQSNTESEILNLSLTKPTDNHVPDLSGFHNDGKIISSDIISADSLLLGKNCYVEIPNSPSLDSLDETMTMMLWVYPLEETRGLVDIFTKGDNHVIQMPGSRSLSFFAGGWGRGDCTISLPENWLNHWHHLAGVCDHNNLKLYIDGVLKGNVTLEKSVNLSVNSKWVIGRNDEFPNQRIFNGYVKKAKVFTRPLSAEEIITVMDK